MRSIEQIQAELDDVMGHVADLHMTYESLRQRAEAVNVEIRKLQQQQSELMTERNRALSSQKK